MIENTNNVMNIVLKIFLITNIIFCKDYLIITSNELSEAAYKISNIYSDDTKFYFLETEVILTSEIDIPINEFISDKIEDDENIKYLLLIGDENNFPYLYKTLPSTSTCNENEEHYPTDDLYSSTGEDQYPRLATGRIPASNLDDALNFANKLENYLENSINGYWKNKIILVSDDEIKAGSSISDEIRHTKYSDDIYNLISDIAFIKTLYGPMYEATYNGSSRRLPELTNDIISNLNDGAALINYIGHGDTEKWGAEYIIEKDRDVSLINIPDNKLPIWMAGTCYFGRYDNTESISESLLFEANAAISIIGATRAIRIDINKTFLDNFYTNIKASIEDPNNNSRLGDIFLESKNQLIENYYLGTSNCPDDGGYLFDILGDPALPLPFAKADETTMVFPQNIELLDKLDISPENNDEYSYIEMYSSNNEISLNFEEEDEIVNLTFNYPNIIYQDEFLGYSCYIPPIDLISYESIKMKYYSEILNNISVNYSDEININDISNEDYNLMDDLTGPEISFWMEGMELLDNSQITSNNTIDVLISDPLDINTSNTIGHSTKFWFNNDDISLINQYEITHLDACTGITFPVLIDSEDENILYIETWDSANNKSLDSLKINSTLPYTNSQIFNVYNFPNPFSNRTFFTYQIKNIPDSNVHTKLTIYSQNGIILNTIEDTQKNNFISIEWDGKDYKSNFLSNGTYMYTLDIKLNNKNYNRVGVFSIIK